MTKIPSVTEARRFLRLSRATTIAVLAVVLVVSLVIMKPEAPKKIILLTGPEGSGYHELGKRYADYLGEQGLETEVRVTLGGLENVEELAAGARYPAKLLKTLNRAAENNDPSAVERAGIHYAAQQSAELLDNSVAGIHFYTLNKSHATRQIYACLGL